jgi:hypothetical protein
MHMHLQMQESQLDVTSKRLAMEEKNSNLATT